MTFLRMVILWSGFFVMTALALPQYTEEPEKVYPLRLQPELDNINLDKYLANDRLINLQIKCILYNGPCDAVGRWVKPRVAASFYGECPLCTPKQKQNVEKIIGYFQEKRPEEYRLAIVKFLKNSGIQAPSEASPAVAAAASEVTVSPDDFTTAEPKVV